ncbi:MAG: DUF2784 domain-containing protein, partial [Thermocrispum sp.]
MSRTLADLVAAGHGGFLLFMIFGGFFAGRRLWVLVAHLAAVTWASTQLVVGYTCPLTFAEKWLRVRSGGVAYTGDYMDHYVHGVLHPQGWDKVANVVAAVVVMVPYSVWAQRRSIGRGCVPMEFGTSLTERWSGPYPMPSVAVSLGRASV